NCSLILLSVLCVFDLDLIWLVLSSFFVSAMASHNYFHLLTAVLVLLLPADIFLFFLVLSDVCIPR
uniref:Uncharacterized protein n=1 Tax=Aegilops tauschii subsp. strangulata TaxID=200361 RepID=A0A453RA29_AEGTS